MKGDSPLFVSVARSEALDDLVGQLDTAPDR
jgi:hypothetical protein